MDGIEKAGDEAMLTRMAQVLRHRLRNIAAGMRGALNVIDKDAGAHLPPELREYFPLLLRECDALGGMAERLGKLFCPLDASAGPMRGDLLLRHVADDVARQFPGANLQIEGDCCAGISAVLGPALKELLVNACETAPHAVVAIRVRHDAAGFNLTVSDTGPGIVEADVRRQAFDPFFTTRPRHLGIGLALARRLAVSAGGCCEAVEPPEGAAGRWVVRLTSPVMVESS